MNLFEQLPKEMNEWKEIAERAQFFGFPLSGMSREQLLIVIGQLLQEKDNAFKRRTQREQQTMASGRTDDIFLDIAEQHLET